MLVRRAARRALPPAAHNAARAHHPDPLNPSTKGWRSAVKEGEIPTTAWEAEVKRGLELGLPAASSIEDRDIPTFSRGELPHFAGINTFMKAPYLEDVRRVGDYDATVMGVPFDGGTTYRSGTRFGPQGIRRISALYSPYNYETGVDLREQMTLCDAGDVFTIPANIEKTFDQISNAVAHVAASGSFPVILGGDHSIGFPTVRGLASVTSKRIGMRWDAPRTPRAAADGPHSPHTSRAPPAAGIIHFDRHADIQETDLDERMHTTPYFHATAIPNVRPENLVQIGIGGWQARRAPRCPLVAHSSHAHTVLTASLPCRHRRCRARRCRSCATAAPTSSRWRTSRTSAPTR